MIYGWMSVKKDALKDLRGGKARRAKTNNPEGMVALFTSRKKCVAYLQEKPDNEDFVPMRVRLVPMEERHGRHTTTHRRR